MNLTLLAVLGACIAAMVLTPSVTTQKRSVLSSVLSTIVGWSAVITLGSYQLLVNFNVQKVPDVARELYVAMSSLI